MKLSTQDREYIKNKYNQNETKYDDFIWEKPNEEQLESIKRICKLDGVAGKVNSIWMFLMSFICFYIGWFITSLFFKYFIQEFKAGHIGMVIGIGVLLLFFLFIFILVGLMIIDNYILKIPKQVRKSYDRGNFLVINCELIGIYEYSQWIGDNHISGQKCIIILPNGRYLEDKFEFVKSHKERAIITKTKIKTLSFKDSYHYEIVLY